MTSSIFRSLIFKLSVIGVVFGLLLNFGDSIIHLIFESIHILFEIVEVTLDNIVETLFETGVHQTQIIVFYLMIVIAVVVLYYSYHALLGCYRFIVATCVEFKTITVTFWQNLNLMHKIACIIGLITLIILKLMLLGYM